MLRDAEQRVEVVRRHRRSEKSGASDLQSAWCLASFAFAQQVQAQLRRGAELAKLPTVGPTIVLDHQKRKLVCMPVDEWELLGETVIIPGSHFVGIPLTKEQKKIPYPC